MYSGSEPTIDQELCTCYAGKKCWHTRWFRRNITEQEQGKVFLGFREGRGMTLTGRGIMENVVTGRRTYFAPPERDGHEKVLQSIDLISRNPLIDTLLQSVGGLLAVLNEHRQILAVNNALLEALEVENADDLFGLRPGEAIQCVHAHDMADGCGTSKYCATCGAAVALVTSLSVDGPVERDCAATIMRKGREEDIYLRVRAHGVTIDEHRFTMLFLQDMTENQRRATLERVFFHDINNLLAGLVGDAETMQAEGEGFQSERAKRMLRLAMRLAKEIEIHSAILRVEGARIMLMPESMSAVDVSKEINEIFANHRAAKKKQFLISPSNPDVQFVTDRSLLIRVLANAVTNALEATAEAGAVRFWHEIAEDGVTFCVWNDKEIPESVALRIFQKSFTTKETPGRGIGTYVMKLLTEEYLGGTVDFTTSEPDGTVFRVHVPAKPASDGS
ncbi:MAG: HAMP domain-containing histidine kinase [Lentisphaerae bacterium]|nr:HAMP domain-containing histidine kinase [Lentisphaerota bacterium]